MKKFKIVAFLTALLLLIQTGMPIRVFAADGKLSIAVSAKSVNVGDTVTVTLSATGSNGEKATADMEFTYSTATFSFESCGAPGYTGGADGKVNASGGTVTVKLKAIAEGDCRLKVTGSNGKIKASGEGLSNMVAAGVVIQAEAAGTATTGSSDNSLSALSLSVGELSPAFAYSTTSYTAEVPYETTGVEVSATPSNSNAKVESITGNTDFQVGENTISITVAAENGSKAAYKIVVTRAGEPAGTTDPGTDPAGQETTDDQIEEYRDQITYWKNQYMKQYEKNESQKSFFGKLIAVLVFVMIVLIIACINLLLFKRRQNAGSGEDIFPEEPRSGKVKRRNRYHDPEDSVEEEPEAHATEHAVEEEPEAYATEYAVEEEPEAYATEHTVEKEPEAYATEHAVKEEPEAYVAEHSVEEDQRAFGPEGRLERRAETYTKTAKIRKNESGLQDNEFHLEFIDLEDL